MDCWAWSDFVAAGIELCSLIFLGISNVQNDNGLILFSCALRWLFTYLFLICRMLSLLLPDGTSPWAYIAAASDLI